MRSTSTLSPTLDSKGYKLKYGAVGAAVGLVGFIGGPVGLLTCPAGGIAGFYLGKIIGEWRTFHLKLEAQNYLCQWKIEQNTRPS